MNWSIRYPKATREAATAVGNGLAAVGFVCPDGMRVESVGPVGPKGLAYLRRAMAHLDNLRNEEFPSHRAQAQEE